MASGKAETLSLNKQMRTAKEFRDIVIKSSNGNFVRLSDVADIEIPSATPVRSRGSTSSRRC